MPAADRTTPATTKKRIKRKPAPAPTRQQVAQARSQARQYGSQGRAVEKRAQELKKVQRRRGEAQKTRQHEARDIKSEANLGRAKEHQERLYAGKLRKRGAPTPTLPPDLEKKRSIRIVRQRRQAETAKKVAPALKVLEQTVRPAYGVAGGARAAIRGENIPKAVGRGVALKDKYLFSDVLKEAGVKNKIVRGVAGTILDIGLDPTTYFTGGVASGARKAALKASKKALRVTPTPIRAATTEKEIHRAATRAAVSHRTGIAQAGAEAPTLAERAAKRAATKAQAKPRGVSVRFAGKEVPGVRRATAAVGAGTKKATDKPKLLRKAKAGTRKLAADVNPSIVPEGLTRAEYAQVRQATRTARHTIGREAHTSRLRAKGIEKAIGKENFERVNDAIESGTLKGLPAELQEPARVLRSQYRYIRRVQRRAGIPVREISGKARTTLSLAERKQRIADLETIAKGAEASAAAQRASGRFKLGKVNEVYMERAAQNARKQIAQLKAGKESGVRGYVPHVRADLLEEGQAMGVKSTGKRTIRPSSSMARKEKRSLAELRQAEPGKYIEDPHILYAARMHEGTKAKAQAELNRRLADMGRTVKQGVEVELGPSEGIFHVVGSDLKALDRKAERAFAEGKLPQKGRYVVLNKQGVDRAMKTVVPAGERSQAGLIFDKAQGVWKLAATQPNPGFHVRNIVGDASNAYVAAAGYRLPKNVGAAGKTLTAIGRQEQALTKLGRITKPTKGGVKTPKYGNVGYDQLGKELAKVGAIRSGFQSRELHDLLKSGMEGTGTRGQRLRRWVNNREDIFRAATAIDALRRGKSFEEAAAHAADFHFDYSDLTELERKVLRRVFPFYTWSARNIPLQLKSVITRPGKYAQYEKIREELAKAFGYEDDWEKDLPEREQRGVPFPVKIGGKEYTIGLGPSGLPLTDLNEFPTSKNPAKQADEWIERAMSLVTPAIKTPVELWANMSFFFRDRIEREEGPLVPAPSWVSKIPKKYRDDLGIVPDYVDKRTGKKQWGAPAKVVYALGVLPGPINFANRVLTPSERAGKTTGSKILGYGGVRSVPVDKISTQIENLYEERGKVEKKMAAWNQRGINIDNTNAAYDRLRQQEKDITSHIMALRTQRGDKILPGRKSTKPKWGQTGGGVKWPDKASGIKWPD